MSKQDKNVGGWAHDFRTVAASLLTYADLYAVSGCTKEQFLDGLRSNCRWFLELVDGMAEHVEGVGELSGPSSSLSIPSMRDLVEAVVDAHRLAIQKPGIRLIIDVERDLKPLAFQQVVIVKRIIANLLSNAIRHSQGRAVLIRVARATTSDRSASDEICVLEVQDYGTGITRQQIKRLMQQEPATNAPLHSSRQRRGLATTRQLVDCLAGKLSIQSQFGKGTRFSVEFVPGESVDSSASHLPQSIKAVTPARQSETYSGNTQAAPNSTPHVLLIDDDPDLRNLITALLLTNGIQTYAIADDHLPMDCELSAFDCVLLDLNLGAVNGCDVAKRLRDAGFEKPILALTAEPLSKLASPDRRGMMDEFDGWIDKTAGGSAVAVRLREVLADLHF